jgi:two-component system, cell cycle sensor histidine kinase and response regulator CckA
MSATLKILHVEDNPDDAELVARELRRGGLKFELQHAHDQATFLAALTTPPELVLSDFALPQFDGLTALSLLKQRYPDTPFILVSGAIGEDLAVAAMREGASDYILKDRLSRLPTAIESALSRAALRRENQQLEARLLRAARLESLGRLSAGIAHDLNNILLPIMMAEQLLREYVNEPSGVELLDSIEKSARRGAQVLKQLLMFGRGTSGERVLVRPEQSLAEIQAVMRETFPKDVSVRVSKLEPGAVVSADPTQLHQILLNLCVNARDAMPNGGTLTLGLGRRVLTPELARKYPGSTPGPHVVLSVSDTGSGISEANLEKIFEPFFTTKGLEQGTGLGLSSVLGIVQSYGGFVQVQSLPEQGTEFEVWLHEHEGGVVSEVRGIAPGRAAGRGQLVLVVDDEPDVLDVLGASITRSGYRVISAPDGAAALEKLDERASEIVAVVADFSMPRLDGLGLVRQIRGRRADLPIVIMTAALSLDKRASFARLGVGEFLIKPFQADALLASLDRVLSVRPASSSALGGSR